MKLQQFSSRGTNHHVGGAIYALKFGQNSEIINMVTVSKTVVRKAADKQKMKNFRLATWSSNCNRKLNGTRLNSQLVIISRQWKIISMKQIKKNLPETNYHWLATYPTKTTIHQTRSIWSMNRWKMDNWASCAYVHTVAEAIVVLALFKGQKRSGRDIYPIKEQNGHHLIQY